MLKTKQITTLTPQTKEVADPEFEVGNGEHEKGCILNGIPLMFASCTCGREKLMAKKK